MPQYLSPGWIEELDAAARSSDALKTATADASIVVQQLVQGGPDGDIAFHVVADHGDVAVRPGAVDRADVTFTQDHATAAAIGRGELSAQTAFMVGKLRVTGDLELLVRQADAFSAVDDVFDDVRARTTWPPA